MAARLPVPRIAIANKKESVVFIRLRVELIFSEVLCVGVSRHRRWVTRRLGRLLVIIGTVSRRRRLWFLIRECAMHCANTLCRNDRCQHMGLWSHGTD